MFLDDFRKVANAKIEGDTIVVASNEDEQHCVFVTEDGHQVMQRTNEDGSTVLTLESAYADAVAQLVPNQVTYLFSIYEWNVSLSLAIEK